MNYEKRVKNLLEQLEEDGAITEVDGFFFIPYNHFNYDLSWVVIVIAPSGNVDYLCVLAKTAEEAVEMAFIKYQEDEDGE